MGEKESKKKNKNQKQQLFNDQASYFSFKPSCDVKGLRFGLQCIVKSFPIRRARPIELLKLLSFPPTNNNNTKNNNNFLPFPSTIAFIPSNFTILAHQTWHTLTLGLGNKKSKVVLFVFENEAMKGAIDGTWPNEIALGDVNKKLIKGLKYCEMARFKFRKGCITFYIYAVRKVGSHGFSCEEDLRTILQSVLDLKDFLDHTNMPTMSQKTVSF